MADINRYVEVEFEQIEKILAQLPSSCSNLSVLEQAGAAALLHNFYNGIENILKRIIQARNLELPQGESWHRDLIRLANSAEIITNVTAEELKKYVAFRHFFSHAYALELYPEKLEPLVQNTGRIFQLVKSDIWKAHFEK